MAPIRTIVVDDSLLIREGVGRLLEFDSDVEVIAACATASEALQAAGCLRPDVVLTDVRMPPSHTDEGILLARELREKQPALGVVVLSQHLTVQYATGLLDEGSAGRGYLLKDRLHDLDTLSRALRTVAAGGCYVDPLVVEALTRTATRGGSSPLEQLTRRELEILADIAEGASNQAIAERRVLTKGVVEKHASAIFRKLGLSEDHAGNRRVKAVLLYLSEGQP